MALYLPVDWVIEMIIYSFEKGPFSTHWLVCKLQHTTSVEFHIRIPPWGPYSKTEPPLPPNPLNFDYVIWHAPSPSFHAHTACNISIDHYGYANQPPITDCDLGASDLSLWQQSDCIVM